MTGRRVHLEFFICGVHGSENGHWGLTTASVVYVSDHNPYVASYSVDGMKVYCR